MTALQQSFSELKTLLEKIPLHFALVGGLAVSVRTEPRFTKDIDIAIAVKNDREAEAVILQLSKFGFIPFSTVEQDETGRLATARLLNNSSKHQVVVDLLFASSGIEKEIVTNADNLEIFIGTFFPVASSGHLLALKILSENENRPQDIADIKALLLGATIQDVECAQNALRQIEHRKFNRNRNLQESFVSFLDRFQPNR